MVARLTATLQECVMPHRGRFSGSCGQKIEEMACQILNHTLNQRERWEISRLPTVLFFWVFSDGCWSIGDINHTGSQIRGC